MVDMSPEEVQDVLGSTAGSASGAQQAVMQLAQHASDTLTQLQAGLSSSGTAEARHDGNTAQCTLGPLLPSSLPPTCSHCSRDAASWHDSPALPKQRLLLQVVVLAAHGNMEALQRWSPVSAASSMSEQLCLERG